ncbi:MAG: HD domain-containing protein [Deltaproteobacteria bacterium]|nr:HD domain-containing protein [Deltaproteobacteria bacterium]
MASAKLLGRYEAWFEEYAASYMGMDPEADRAAALKREHTLKVRDEMLFLGKSLGLSGEDLAFAAILGIFHDLGRFPQFAKYRTLSDAGSVNHAALSVRVLHARRLLDRLDPEDRKTAVFAVALHNRPLPPSRGPRRRVFFCRLLRDADKLDIYRVICGHYQEGPAKGDEIMDFALPDEPPVSAGVEEAVLAGRPARMEDLRTLNDLKLFQAAWVFDMNFAPTLKAVADRGYVEVIRAHLPDTPLVKEAFKNISKRLENPQNFYPPSPK